MIYYQNWVSNRYIPCDANISIYTYIYILYDKIGTIKLISPWLSPLPWPEALQIVNDVVLETEILCFGRSIFDPGILQRLFCGIPATVVEFPVGFSGTSAGNHRNHPINLQMTTMVSSARMVSEPQENDISISFPIKVEGDTWSLREDVASWPCVGCLAPFNVLSR